MQSFTMQVFEVCKAFHKGTQRTVEILSDIVKALDQDFTCQDVYAAVGTGTAVTLFASIFPGVGPAVNGATKVIYFYCELHTVILYIYIYIYNSLFL